MVTYHNFTAGSSESNTAIIALGADGKIQLRASAATNLVVDVQGYYSEGAPAAGGFNTVAPARLVDTRIGLGLPTGKINAATVKKIQIGGNADVPSNASAVAVNFTIVEPTAAGSFKAYPSGAPIPTGGDLANSTGRRNTLITEVCGGEFEEAVAGATGGRAAAVGRRQGAAAGDAVAGPSGAVAGCAA
ncbi:MAG: hypothetical protein Q8Q02_13930 [Nocardioides sp.]|nr:hypothetical protein [Nocardioides sp.]